MTVKIVKCFTQRCLCWRPEPDLYYAMHLSTGTDPQRHWGQPSEALLICIRATVALDVQSGLNSQAAGVGSTSRPISKPRLPRESCSLCDLGCQQVIEASPPRPVAPNGDSADRQTVQSSRPSVGDSTRPISNPHSRLRGGGWGLC